MSKLIYLIMQTKKKKKRFKKATGIDTSSLSLKANLAALKAEVYKINVDKLNTVPTDLSKLSNIVDNEVVKETLYDKLVAEVNNIDTSWFVLNTKYNTDKSDLEKKISDADKKILILVNLLKNSCKTYWNRRQNTYYY